MALDWDISTIQWSGRDDDGFPIAQFEGYGNDGGYPYPVHHQYGYYSRPHDPIENTACTVFFAKDGDERFGFLGVDPRFIQDVPLPSKGGNVRYVAFPDGDDYRIAWSDFSGDDGTWRLYIPTGDSSAISVVFGKDGAGNPTIEIVQDDGAAVILHGGSVVLRSPSGGNYVQVSDSGIVLKGPISQVGGLTTPGGIPLVKGPEFLNWMRSVSQTLVSIAGVVAKNSTSLSDPASASAVSGLATELGLTTVATATTVQTLHTKGS